MSDKIRGKIRQILHKDDTSSGEGSHLSQTLSASPRNSYDVPSHSPTTTSPGGRSANLDKDLPSAPSSAPIYEANATKPGLGRDLAYRPKNSNSEAEPVQRKPVGDLPRQSQQNDTPVKGNGVRQPVIGQALSPGLNTEERDARTLASHQTLPSRLRTTDAVRNHGAHDTTVTETLAPAVTHETIRHDVHEVRHEQIYRDVHEYHNAHRIQPIEHVEHLPARHFIQDDQGGLREISENQVKPWLESEHAAYRDKMMLESKKATEPNESWIERKELKSGLAKR